MDNTDDSLESSTTPLAAVVEPHRTEIAIESLHEEGVYDDSRRIQPVEARDDEPDKIALPITEVPTETDVLEIVRQLEPTPRAPDVETLLAERGWSEADLEKAPRSWAVVGSVLLVTIPEDCPDETDVAEALLECHGEADSVLADEGIANDGTAGTVRKPRTRLLAGESDTETIHTEDGTRYGLDPREVMFSPGNQAERVRMGEICDPDEHVFDMFAGIGYFTLPMARAGARVTATELNPVAFRYLLENAMVNDVADRVDAYMTDCREIAADLEADRIVMGYYGSGDSNGDESSTRSEEASEFLPDALSALDSGGVIHYHEATPESRLWERPLERLEAASEAAGRDLEVLECRRVKSHSAGVSHVVVDARFE